MKTATGGAQSFGLRFPKVDWLPGLDIVVRNSLQGTTQTTHNHLDQDRLVFHLCKPHNGVSDGARTPSHRGD